MRLLLIILGAFAAIVCIERPAEAQNGATQRVSNCSLFAEDGTSLFILGVFAAVACAERPAEAQNHPWCAYYGPAFGATNCGFATFQQCLATVSSCEPNPMYQPAPGPYPSTRHPRRHSY
jgi:hypothetical protein